MSRDVTDIHDAALKCGFYEWNSSKRIFQDQETANIASASDLQPSKKKAVQTYQKVEGRTMGHKLLCVTHGPMFAHSVADYTLWRI